MCSRKRKGEHAFFIMSVTLCVVLCVYAIVYIHACIVLIVGLGFCFAPLFIKCVKVGVCVDVRLGRVEVQRAGAPWLAACVLIISHTREVCRRYLGKDTILKNSPVIRIRYINSGA